MAGRSANTDDGARVDIRARGFWNASQDAFFDVRVFYPNASSNRSTNPLSVYRKHEQAKKREYGQRVRDVERGVFTPDCHRLVEWERKRQHSSNVWLIWWQRNDNNTTRS